jgi:putative membrane protein insertion efficiency factor
VLIIRNREAVRVVHLNDRNEGARTVSNFDGNQFVQQQPPGPPTRPAGRAWVWLSAQERQRRIAQRRAWKAWKSRNRRTDSDGGGGSGPDCGGCDGCLIVMIPLVSVAGLKAVAAGVRSRRGGTPDAAPSADPAAPTPQGAVAAGLYGAIRHYRTEISPNRPACCRFTPTCSTYAVQALHRHGARRGLRLTARRLRRCRPGAAIPRGGADPVPR